MRRVLSIVDRGLFWLPLGLAMALMAAMTCVTFYQVVTRFVFEQPSTWSEVTARALNIWMVYLGLVAAFRLGTLMAVDLLIGRLHGIARRLCVALIAAVSGAALAVMLWFGWDMAHRVRFQTLAGVVDPFTGDGISIAWVYAAVPVGAALCLLALAAHTAEALVRDEPPAAPARER